MTACRVIGAKYFIIFDKGVIARANPYIGSILK